jgi:hypothetical protein
VLVSDSAWAMLNGEFKGVAQAPVMVKNRDRAVLTYLIVVDGATKYVER